MSRLLMTSKITGCFRVLMYLKSDPHVVAQRSCKMGNGLCKHVRVPATRNSMADSWGRCGQGCDYKGQVNVFKIGILLSGLKWHIACAMRDLALRQFTGRQFHLCMKCSKPCLLYAHIFWICKLSLAQSVVSPVSSRRLHCELVTCDGRRFSGGKWCLCCGS